MPRMKLTHRQAKFHTGNHGGDRCGNCSHFVRQNLCTKVLGPLSAEDWCAVGTAKSDGHRYSPEARKLEGGIQSIINRREKETSR